MDAIISSYSVWESSKTFLPAKFKGCSTVDMDKFIATLIPIYALTTHLRSSETNNSLVHLPSMNSKDQDWINPHDPSTAWQTEDNQAWPTDSGTEPPLTAHHKLVSPMILSDHR